MMRYLGRMCRDNCDRSHSCPRSARIRAHLTGGHMSLVRIFTFATLFLLILSPVRSARAQGDITGNWLADAGGIYYFRQIGDEVFGAGVSTQSDPLGATEFQAGLQFTSLLHGHVRPATDDDAFLPFGRPLSVMTAAWVDVPRGTILGRGTIVFAVFPSFLLRTASSTTVPNGLEGALWTRLPTRVWPVNTPSGFEAFGRTQRNDGGTMADHLNLYRDDTVLYGEVARFPGAIHVNFPGIGSGILPTYYNMIGADCNGPKDNHQRIGWWPVN